MTTVSAPTACGSDRLGRPVLLRARTEADTDVVRRVFAGARERELAVLGELGPAYVDQQLHARDVAYATATHEIVLVAGEPAGYLVTRVTDAAVELVDLALLPGVRGHGIGSLLVQHVLTLAAARDRPVRLYVAAGNPAQRLYAQAGFTVTGTAGAHLTMEWTSSCSTVSPS